MMRLRLNMLYTRLYAAFKRNIHNGILTTARKRLWAFYRHFQRLFLPLVRVRFADIQAIVRFHLNTALNRYPLEYIESEYQTAVDRPNA